MPRKVALAALLIAAIGFPQQLFASPSVTFTTWLDELVTSLVSLWEVEDTDREVLEFQAESTESGPATHQPPEVEDNSEGATEEEPPIANAYPQWEPGG